MKRFFTLLACGLMAAAPSLAQEEDVTHYIANPGFDQDITFNTDGSTKAIVNTQSLSGRSIANIAEDNSVYARPTETSSQTRPDGRKMEAVNGFIGQIKGWTAVPSAEFPQCEWVYFGSLPYALTPESIPVADDGSTYLEVPAKPEADSGDDNLAALYLRAGWGASCIYKQDVKLPCAVYRLDYYIYNANYASSSSNTNVKNLCKVTCRKDVFEDEEGFNAQEWTLHSIEFTPVSEFSIQFGFQSSGGSGSNPFLFIDGIKLYKIGEADPIEVLKGDLDDMISSLYELEINDETGETYEGLQDEIDDLADNFGAIIDKKNATVEELQQASRDLTAAIEHIKEAMEAAKRVIKLIDKAEQLEIATVTYPGLDDLVAAATTARETLYQNGKADDIIAAEKTMQDAITAYYSSQEPTMDNPANYTHLVQNPWFCPSDREPASNSVEDIEAAGLTSEDKTSEGWVNGSTSGGDQFFSFYTNARTCYQLWNTNFSGYLDVHQELTGLPNGIYSVSADMITNTDALSDQHVYATSTLGTTEGYMTEAGVLYSWTNGAYEGETVPWETVTAEGTVIVADGKLTIGARSTHDGRTDGAEDISSGGRRGCFWVTNFVLRYHGEASESDIAQATQAVVNEAEQLAGSLPFAADAATMRDAINEYSSTGDLSKLQEAIAFGKTSSAKYDEINEEGKTLPTVKANLEGDAQAAYGAAVEIVRFAYNSVITWMASSEATYKEVDNQLNLAKKYINDYVTAFNDADATATQLSDATAKDVLTKVMNTQKAQMTTGALKTSAEVDELIADLKSAVNVCLAQETYSSNPDATDFTGYIKNPGAESEAGWTLEKGKGDKNSTAGQHYTGDSSRRYFDSYNGTEGALNFYGEQVVKGLPNGTYTVKAAVRTSGEGAFIFAKAEADTAFVEIPLQTYFNDNLGETENATDKYGQIWQDAWDAGEPEEYMNANNGAGFGWMWLEIEGVEVSNHKLTIGMTTNRPQAKPFTGKWFSVTDWSLTMTAKGDNNGWSGPITGVETIRTAATGAQAIYTIDGRRVATAQKGLYIIRQNGEVRKVMVR